MVILSELLSLVSCGKIIWTEHLAQRLRTRKIKRIDIVNCIRFGTIIEQYPEDIPFPSCLMLGSSLNGDPLHVVCAINPGIYCCIITAYFPDSDKWDADNQTRKEKK